MCNIGDSYIDDLDSNNFMPIKEDTTISKCNKCKTATPFVILRSKDKYCKECFKVGTVHKFKALLGKHKLTRLKNEKVLILHEGGHSTTALLHFIRLCIDLEPHKRLECQPIVLYLEDNKHLSESERHKIIKEVEAEVNYFKFPLISTTLADLLSKGPLTDILKTNPNEIKFLQNEDVLFNTVTNNSNKTNGLQYLKILRRNFLFDIAKHLNCKIIFTNELSNETASHLLTGICLGQGASIALDTAFSDSRNINATIVRPLKMFDIKELAIYNYLNNLEPVVIKKLDISNSVQELMTNFVNGLQLNYPATVTTILKTGDKLDPNLDNLTKCDFCQALTEENNSELNAAEATEFSHWISHNDFDESILNLPDFNKRKDNLCFSCTKLQFKNSC